MAETQSQEGFPVISQYYKGIYEGMVVKNYKEMCRLLNEKVLGGDSKKAQHKEWQRYFDYERDGQKYIIIQIYSEPLPKDDKRSQGNKSEYLPYIQILLFNHLLRQNDYVTYLTVSNMFELFGLTNKKYIEKDYNDILNILDIQSEKEKTSYIGHFYQRTYKKLNRILFDSLKNLKSRCLIDFEEERIICIDEKSSEGEIVKIYRKATDEEMNIIRDIKRELLEEFGFDSMFQIQARLLFSKFYEKLNNILYNRYGIHYTYKRVKILFTHQYIEKELEKTQVRIEMEKLNNKVIDFFNNEAQRNYERNEEGYKKYEENLLEHCIGKPCPSDLRQYYKYTENYKYSQEKLAEYLLRI